MVLDVLRQDLREGLGKLTAKCQGHAFEFVELFEGSVFIKDFMNPRDRPAVKSVGCGVGVACELGGPDTEVGNCWP